MTWTEVYLWQKLICRVKAPRSSWPPYALSCFYSSHKQNESLQNSTSECCYAQEETQTPAIDISRGHDTHSPGSQVLASSLPPVCFFTQELIFLLDFSGALKKFTAFSSTWYRALVESKYCCKTGKRGGSHDGN